MGNAIVKASDLNLDELQRMAKMMVASGYFDAAKDPTQAVAQMAIKIMAGREMGYGPFASVQGIHVIQGKPTVAANLMAAAIKNHPRYNYKIRKMQNDCVSIEFFENGESVGVSEFTQSDAQAAGLLGKDIWKKFPRNMLFSRALSNGVRWYCPDVFDGNAVYTPEELGATVDYETGEVIEQPLAIKVVSPEVIQAEQKPTPSNAEIDQAIDKAPELNPDGGNPFDGPTPPKLGAITKAQTGTLHALGVALYGDTRTWDAKRHGIVKAITNGRIESSAMLTQAEAKTLIEKLETKIREHYEMASAELVELQAEQPDVDTNNLFGVELANAYTALCKLLKPQEAPVAVGK